MDRIEEIKLLLTLHQATWHNEQTGEHHDAAGDIEYLLSALSEKEKQIAEMRKDVEELKKRALIFINRAPVVELEYIDSLLSKWSK